MPSTTLTPHLNPPKQSRSRRTLERIVRASLDILEADGSDALTVQAVVDRAGSSVGSFYARFGGKDDLLDYLGERVWREALERWNDALTSPDWSELDLRQLAEGCVGLLADAQTSRSSYLKALDRATGGTDSAYDAFRRHLVDGIAGLLLRHEAEIDHPRPELAVRLGLLGVIGVIDADDPAGNGPLPRETLVSEATDLLLGYLTAAGGPQTASSAETVDFFDVWG